MNVSLTGIAFTKRREGCRLVAYLDGAGVPTIGWGHTGPEVHLGLVWTQEQCDAQFLLDIQKYEDAVNNAITVVLTQAQFDALFDFAYNEGCSALLHSTLCAHINAGGSLTGLFEVWDKIRVNGVLVVSEGLLNRRKAEDTLYTTGDYGVLQ